MASIYSLGLVKLGDNINIATDGTISAVIPTISTASTQTVGGIKVDGTIHAINNDTLKIVEPPSNAATIANKILMYPPIRDFFGISGKTTTLSGLLYGNGDYTISYTEALNDANNEPSKVFNSAELYGGQWKLGNYTNGVYNKTSSFINAAQYFGDGVKIQLPFKIKLTSFSLKLHPDFLSRAPKGFKIWGSNDGSTWYELLSNGNITYDPITYTYTESIFLLPPYEHYNHFALVVNTLQGVSTDTTNLVLKEWYIYGIKITQPTDAYNYKKDSIIKYVAGSQNDPVLRDTGSWQIIDTDKVATSTSLGIVKGGSDIQISADGTLSSLIATQYSLGIVKGGDNIKIASNGTISCPVANQTGILGLVKKGDNIVISADGTISCVLPTATSSSLGVVKGGANITIDADGTLTGVGFITASTIPAPVQNTIGGVRRGGANIDIIDDGTISATIPIQYITETLLTAKNYLTTIPVASTGTVGGLKVDGIITTISNNTLKLVEPTSIIAYSSLTDIRMYPPIRDFFGASGKTTTVSGQLYGNGDYTIHYNSAYNDAYAPSTVFNSTNIIGGVWSPANYSNGGVYDRQFNLIDSIVGDTSYLGDGVKIQFPVSIKISYYKFILRPGYVDSAPKDFKIYGSNNGTDWTILLYKTTIIFENDSYTEYISTNEYYSHFALTVNKVQGNSIWLVLDEWYIYGQERPAYYHKKDSIIKYVAGNQSDINLRNTGSWQIVDDISTEYITESELTSRNYLTTIPTEYITETELTAKNYLTTIPAEYITETELTAKNYLTTIPTEYITETLLTAKNYLTTIPAEYVDIYTLDNMNYLTSVPAEYITETELISKNYITMANVNNQNYVTQADVDAVNNNQYVTLSAINEASFVTVTVLDANQYLNDASATSAGFIKSVPIATLEIVGGVRRGGANIDIDLDGIISWVAPPFPTIAGTNNEPDTNPVLGNVIVDGLSITIVPETGVISSYWKLATTEIFGFVKGGGNISISPSGEINAIKATSAVAGIVKPDNSTITVNENGTISAIIPNTVATSGSLGLVKIGTNMKIALDGTINCPVANSTGILGLVKQGDFISIAADGAISSVLPTATNIGGLGCVRGGGNVSINATGVLSVVHPIVKWQETPSFHLLNTNTGNVGIGTNDASSYKLQVVGSIGSSGNITAFYSDERLKDITEYVSDVLPILSKIKVFRYKCNDLAASYGYDKNKKEIGLSAQEIQKYYPEVVSIAPFDAMKKNGSDEIISKSGENYLTLDYERLVPVLLQGIKDLNNELNDIKTRLKKLEI
jgi:hypothetical protein